MSDDPSGCLFSSPAKSVRRVEKIKRAFQVEKNALSSEALGTLRRSSESYPDILLQWGLKPNGEAGGGGQRIGPIVWKINERSV